MARTNRIASLALLALMAGCSAAPAQDGSEASSVEQALGQDFGGMTAQAEMPMFSAPDTFAKFGEVDEDVAEVAPADDAIGTQVASQVQDAIAKARSADLAELDRPLVYAIALTWGRKQVDPDAKVGLAWNPTVSTDCGAIAVRRLIQMEPGEGVVRPRASAKSVSFKSATLPSFDGALVALLIPRGANACAADGKLRFESEALPAAIEVPLDDSLADLVLRAPAPAGNHVVALGHKIEPSGQCERGNVSGRWVKVPDPSGSGREVGKFYGRVTDELGELRGHVKGIYGMPVHGRFAGADVFFGKYINGKGEFAGLLAGKYRGLPDSIEKADGVFGGGWHLRPVADASALHGILGGVYELSDEANTDGGTFHGRYASTQCKRPIAEAPLYESSSQ